MMQRPLLAEFKQVNTSSEFRGYYINTNDDKYTVQIYGLRVNCIKYNTKKKNPQVSTNLNLPQTLIVAVYNQILS